MLAENSNMERVEGERNKDKGWWICAILDRDGCATVKYLRFVRDLRELVDDFVKMAVMFTRNKESFKKALHLDEEMTPRQRGYYFWINVIDYEYTYPYLFPIDCDPKDFKVFDWSGDWWLNELHDFEKNLAEIIDEIISRVLELPDDAWKE